MIRYHYLTDLPYNENRQHCQTLVRQFYRDNYDLPIRDFANPKGWWQKGIDLFSRHYKQEGFVAVDARGFDFEVGDLILIAKGSTVANHIGIYLPTGEILHHLVDGLSRTDPYLRGGYWKSLTVAVYRHPEVSAKNEIVPAPTADFWSTLPDNVQSKLVDQGLDLDAEVEV